MKVGRYNYPEQLENLPELMDELRQMLLSGNFILSKEVRDFESAFADYLGVAHARGVNSGTDALIITLLAMGVGPGSEVITQANTFNATVAAISLIGATPVLVDADESSFLINAEQIDASITPNTRVIIPVHLYGKPTPMAEILAIAGRHGISVVEDAAQAHGAKIDGRMVGSFGSAACFSFHPSKNLAAAGDAGAVVTNSQELADSIDRLRSLGQQGQNNHVVIGYNSKLDALQARILHWKLRKLDQWNESRRRIAGWYRERLTALPIGFQAETPSEAHAYHLFVMRTDRRDALLESLKRAGIDAVIRYPVPIHLQPAFERFNWKCGQFPVAERLAKESLCLPIRADMREEEVEFVVSHVSKFFDARSLAAAGGA